MIDEIKCAGVHNCSSLVLIVHNTTLFILVTVAFKESFTTSERLTPRLLAISLKACFSQIGVMMVIRSVFVDSLVILFLSVG